MKYKIITFELMGKSSAHVIVTQEDDSFESFPVDVDNNRFAQFLDETNLTELQVTESTPNKWLDFPEAPAN